MTEERRSCPNVDANNKTCGCASVNCPRHGVCCLCVQHHIQAGNLPVCLRK